jgi:hypothetical protein
LSALLTVEVAEVDGCSWWQRTFSMGAAIDGFETIADSRVRGTSDARTWSVARGY